MIKLFISDLDGTLLNKWHLSDNTINRSIAQLHQRGYQFAVATGRHLRCHQRFSLKFLKHTDYIIAMNGALVMNNAQEILAEIPIARKAVVMLLKEFPELSFECLTATQILVRQSRMQHFTKGFKGNFNGKNVSRAVLNLLAGGFKYDVSEDEILAQNILKIECMTYTPKLKERLIHFLDTHSDQYSYAFNDGTHFEITGSGVNKREGILHLLKIINVHPDQVSVYGNDSNDVEMLMYFTHSYAPSSAKESAKEAANHLIGNAYEHAVVEHILDTIRQQDAYRH